MVELSRAAMEAGAWGLSTSRFDVDKNGRPVPSRAADGDEFDALLDVIQEAGRGLVKFIPDLLGGDAVPTFRDLARDAAALNPVDLDGLRPDRHRRSHRGVAPVHPRPCRRGVRDVSAAVAPHRGISADHSRGSVDDVHDDAAGLEPGHRGRGDEKAAILGDPEWRAGAARNGTAPNARCSRDRRPSACASSRSSARRTNCWLGRTLADLVEEKGGHPSDVFADFVLANDCHPGVVAVGIANSDVEAMGADTGRPVGDRQLLDAGAHMQMLCCSATPRCC